MSQLHSLLRLQEIDTEIREKKQRLREVLQAQKGNQGLIEARQRRERSGEALHEASGRQNALEFELSQITGKRRGSEQRLYSGEVQNPKELADLQHEIESLGRRRSGVEDELLEVMLEVESAQEEDDSAAGQLHELEAIWAQQQIALAREQDQLAARLNALLAARKEQAARLDQKHLAAYDSTAAKRGGVAVARVKDGLCQVCSVRASSSKVTAAHNGQLVRCGSCDRILVVG